MKDLILGVGICICGVILLCTDYIVIHVIGAMPDVHFVGGGLFSLTLLGWVVLLIGALFVVSGCRQED